MRKISKKIKILCEDLNVSEGKKSDEYLFTLDAVDLFYFKKDMSLTDIKAGFCDGPNDGGIDFMFSNDDIMYLVQGKSTENLSIEDIKNTIYKIKETVSNFSNKKYDKYCSELKSTYLTVYDDINEDKNIEIVIFTNTILTVQARDKVDIFLKNQELSEFTISVYDGADIANRELLLQQDDGLVKHDRIELFMSENKQDMLSYGDNGLIVNVKASSLKKLYIKYEAKGLFSYNLREHIKQKNVDEEIEKTIKSDSANFWFYNNGITIGCEDFSKDGNIIKLYGFSIINGAQTTTKIGESKLVDEEHDFPLVCKLVRAEHSIQNSGNFIAKISEASNSQKPIKYRDLKANAIEQKNLQTICAKNKHSLAVEIKRGVKPSNSKKVEKWQRVTNEYLGQLIYACIFQKPGTARNCKASIFSSKSNYKMIFKRSVDANTLYDLVRLGQIYNEYSDDFVKKNTNPDKIALAKNGKLTILAIAIYLLKKERGIVTSFDDSNLTKDNVTGLIITNYPYDDLDKKVNNVFDFILRQVSQLYDQRKEPDKITSYSNFFKSEKYYERILRNFDELDEYDTKKLGEYLTVFSEK